jgi:GTP-binding protein Era
MMKFVESALEDADVLVYIIDITDKDLQEEFTERVAKMEIPVLVVINKIDQSNDEALGKMVEHWHKALPKARIIPVSALHKFNLEPLIKNIVDLLPEAPPFYDKDTLTDKTERFFTSEIIREKIFLEFQQEIPYSTEVIVTEFKEEPKIVRILAYIFVSRDTQKGIILGHQGSAIKKIGSKARKDLEEWLGKKVFLELSVKVRKDWRNDEKALRRFGYSE